MLQANQNKLYLFLKKLQEKKLEIFSILLTSLIYLPIRHVFFTKNAYITGQYSDFTSFSLYGFDILILSFLIYSYLKGKITFGRSALNIILFILIGEIANLSYNISYPIYIISRVIVLIVLHETLLNTLTQQLIKLITKVFIYISIFESIVAIAQFYKQSSIGLKYLAEPSLSVSMFGVAKIIENSSTILRSYGTLPHPNILGAFLMTGLTILYFQIISAKIKSTLYKTGIYFSYSLLAIALVLTFSRSALLGTIVSHGTLTFLYLIKQNKKQAITACLIAISIFTAPLLLTKNLYFSRTSLTDQSIQERISYSKEAYNMIKDKPFFGIGIGQSLTKSEEYLKTKLQPWEFQPIHNYYLLTFSELGIITGLIYLVFIIKKPYDLLKQTIHDSRETNPETFLLLSILCSYLTVMLFDHYFYTIPETQTLLWLTLAISSHYIKNQSK